MNSTGISRLLGYGGLIPFVIPALLVITESPYSELSQVIVHSFAFGIICFLTGSWWGLALSTGSRSLLMLSNLYFLMAFLIFVFARQWWTLAAAILLMSIFFAEQSKALFNDLPGHYRKMRTILTMAASASMLVIHFSR